MDYSWERPDLVQLGTFWMRGQHNMRQAKTVCSEPKGTVFI